MCNKPIKVAEFTFKGRKYDVNKFVDSGEDLFFIENIKSFIDRGGSMTTVADVCNRSNASYTAVNEGNIIKIFKIGDNKLANKLAVFTHENSFLKNYEKDGILANLNRTLHEIIGVNNVHNCRLVPVRFIKDPSGDYWEYKIYYHGDPLEFNSVKNGVRYAEHFFSRHKVSIYGNIAIFKNGIHGETSDTLLSLLSELINNQSYTSAIANLNKAFSSYRALLPGYKEINIARADSVMSPDAKLKVYRSTDLINGVVRTCTIAGTYASPFESGGIIKDMVKFKELLKLPKNCVPNPPLDLDILEIPLVRKTIWNILNRVCLVVTDARFYRRLKHLGIILNDRNLNSVANFFHLWKLCKVHIPEFVERTDIIKFKTSTKNIAGKVLMATIQSEQYNLFTETKDELCIEVITGKLLINSYRLMAKQYNCELM